MWDTRRCATDGIYGGRQTVRLDFKIELVGRLIMRGEDLCAMVCCDDWDLDYDEIARSVRRGQ